MVSIIIKEWTTKIELVPTVQKRNAAVLLRKPGRLAPQYATTLLLLIVKRRFAIRTGDGLKSSEIRMAATLLQPRDA